VKKPKPATAKKSEARKLAEKFTDCYHLIWGVGERCVPATEPHGLGLGKRHAEDTLERMFDSALKRAAREAAWDGFVNGRGREATGFEGWTTLMTRKYGPRPARRKRCDPKT
jgi:hypothetical protein